MTDKALVSCKQNVNTLVRFRNTTKGVPICKETLRKELQNTHEAPLLVFYTSTKHHNWCF